jgi:hypothetical protein
VYEIVADFSATFLSTVTVFAPRYKLSPVIVKDEFEFRKREGSCTLEKYIGSDATGTAMFYTPCCM